MLRIIAGERRGARLRTLEGDTTRPLRDRVREALFSILQSRMRGATVLDLFAGSGAVGLEALSRGAERAVFVEGSEPARNVIADNIAKLRYEDRAAVVAGKLPPALDRVSVPEGGFDLIFSTAPYGRGLSEPTSKALDAKRILAEGGLFVVEIEKGEPFDPAPWSVADDRAYGITRLLFLMAPESAGDGPSGTIE